MEYLYKYPRPAVTADCVVITKEENPKVLLIERGFEPTEQCAIRELEEETGMVVTELLQIGAYSKVDRDPRGRTVTVAYLVLVDHPVEVTGQDDAAKAQWFPIDALPPLAFDHDDIMRDAFELFQSIVTQ